MDPRRRTLLAVLAAGLGGCSMPTEDETTSSTSAPPTTTTRTTTPTETTTTEDTEGPVLSNPPDPARWRATVSDTVSPPATRDGIVFIGSKTGAFYALTAASGQTAWTRSFDQSVLGAPTLAGETLYVETGIYGLGGTPTVTALDVSTGDVAWDVTADSPSGSRTNLDVAGTTADAVYLTTRDDQVKAAGETLSSYTHDGAARWQVEIGDPRGPTITDDAVFVEFGGTLHVFGHDGTRLWKRDGEYSDPVTVGDRALLATEGGGPNELLAIDPRTGTEEWRFDEFDVMGVTVLGSSLLVGGEQLVRLDPTGTTPTVEWQRDGRTWLWFRPTAPVVDGRLFVTTSTGVQALDVETGDELWSTQIDHDYVAVEALTQSTVLVLDQNEHLIALDTATGDRRWTVSSTDAGKIRGVATTEDTILVAHGDAITAYPA